MKVEYDLYKSPPREVDGKEVVHLHARVARSKTISIWSLGDDIQKATSLTKSDLRAVLCEMSDRFVEELQKGAYRRYRLFPDDIIVSGRCGEGRRGAGGIHPF